MNQFRNSTIFKRLCLRTRQNSSSPLTIDDIPQRASLPLIGNKLEFIAAGSGTKLHEFIDHRHKQLGAIFREKLGGGIDLVFVSDPTMIRTLLLSLEGKYPAHILPDPWVLYEKLYGSKRGLFFMDGEEWLQNRRVMNKYLLKEGSENWLEAPVKATVSNFIQKWRHEAENAVNGFVPNLESDFYRLSVDVIIAVMLGNKSTLKPDLYSGDLLETFSESVKKIFKTTTKLHGLPLNLCQKFNFKVWSNFKESVDTSLHLAHKIVGEILNSRQYTNGLVKMLSDDSVRDEDIKKIMGDFVIAAGDTTAFTSLWTLFLLSKHEETRKEIGAGKPNFVNYIIKESMRLYPVAPFLTRIIPKECSLGPYKLKAGVSNIFHK